MEESNELINLTIKIQTGWEFERNRKTNVNVTIVLYKEYEGYLEVRHLWYF